MTLSDTHLVLLSAAARHEHHLLPKPDRVFGTALGKLASRLTRSGLAEEVVVGIHQPCWFEPPMGGRTGLRITAAGLAAIGLGEEVEPQSPRQDQPSGAGAAMVGPADDADGSASPQLQVPSKRALLLHLLRREDGASIGEAGIALAWLPHTVRAALSRLRQAGHGIERSRDASGTTRYRLAEAAEARSDEAQGKA